ncbi:hypothetical protein BH10PSE17_BH10PSE17_38460 [soil metagenome]
MPRRALSERALIRRLVAPFEYFKEQTQFLGSTAIAVAQLPTRGIQFRRQDFARVLADTSGRALVITAVVNVLVGAILAFVGVVQLIKFGAGIYVADLVGIATVREMAAVITAVVISGRTGAAFAAELATMQANEEVDALEVLGIDRIDYLVVPRVLALVVMMPLLYVYGCFAALAGGLIVATGMLNIAPQAYFDRTFDTLQWSYAALGFTKSIAFGALVAMYGCFHGLRAARNAAGVGEATTRAVVADIVGVTTLDAIFAVCANALNI